MTIKRSPKINSKLHFIVRYSFFNSDTRFSSMSCLHIFENISLLKNDVSVYQQIDFLSLSAVYNNVYSTNEDVTHMFISIKKTPQSSYSVVVAIRITQDVSRSHEMSQQHLLCPIHLLATQHLQKSHCIAIAE